MYCSENFKSKKALKEAIKAGQQLTVFAPGLGKPQDNGVETLSGPHYPAPHTWYARVMMENGVIKKVLS